MLVLDIEGSRSSGSDLKNSIALLNSDVVSNAEFGEHSAVKNCATDSRTIVPMSVDLYASEMDRSLQI